MIKLAFGCPRDQPACEGKGVRHLCCRAAKEVTENEVVPLTFVSRIVRERLRARMGREKNFGNSTEAHSDPGNPARCEIEEDKSAMAECMQHRFLEHKKELMEEFENRDATERPQRYRGLSQRDEGTHHVAWPLER